MTPPEGKPPWTAEDKRRIMKDPNRCAGEIATFYL
jgi:hypothetical protein